VPSGPHCSRDPTVERRLHPLSEIAERLDNRIEAAKRLMIVPVTQLADRLGIDREDVWADLALASEPDPARPASAVPSSDSTPRRRRAAPVEMPPLF
jgi:hypothetical protein